MWIYLLILPTTLHARALVRPVFYETQLTTFTWNTHQKTSMYIFLHKYKMCNALSEDFRLILYYFKLRSISNWNLFLSFKSFGSMVFQLTDRWNKQLIWKQTIISFFLNNWRKIVVEFSTKKKELFWEAFLPYNKLISPNFQTLIIYFSM